MLKIITLKLFVCVCACVQILPVASDPQMTIVDLVKSVNTLRAETILQLIREVVKKPHQIKGDQVQNDKYTHQYTAISNINIYIFLSSAKANPS